MNKISVASILIISLIACNKPDNNNQDLVTEKPVIIIYYPAAYENYQPGQQLCFKALLEDDHYLKRVFVSIKDQVKPIKQYEFFPGSRIFIVDEKYIIPEHLSGSLTLEFEAHDNQGNSAKIKLPLSVKL